MIFLLVCLSTISLPRCSMLAKFSLAISDVPFIMCEIQYHVKQKCLTWDTDTCARFGL